MTWLKNLLTNVRGWFATPAAQKRLQQIETLLPMALPLVQMIDAACPKRTIQQIAKAYQDYAVPFSQELATLRPDVAIRDLVTAILKKNHAPDAAISILNAVVELAVNAMPPVAP